MRFIAACLAGIALNCIGAAEAPAEEPQPVAPAAGAPETTAAVTSTTPDAPPPATAATSGSPAPVAQGAPASAPAAKPPPVEDPEVKHLMALGYKPEMRNGTQMYCRQETQLGSRFTQKVCTDPAHSKSRREESRDAFEHAQHSQLNPTGN